MRNELFRSDHLGSPGCHQSLQEFVPRDKEVALAGAAEDEYVL
jgi:hypothetical protein